MSSYKFNWGDTQKVAHDVARKVSRQYPGCEADDIEQEILLEVVKREGTFRHMNYEVPQLYRYLTNYANKYCNEYRIRSYDWDEGHYYSAKEVRALCASALFDTEAFMETVRGNENLEPRADIILERVGFLRDAYDELRDRERDVIYRRYVEHESLENSDRALLYRAINLLVVKINKGTRREQYVPMDYDGPGARKAISNRHAQFIMEEQDSVSLTHRYAAW